MSYKIADIDSERVKEWTDALRSGQFKRGGGSLKQRVVRDDGRDEVLHCCLGVLCEMAGVANEFREGGLRRFVFEQQEGLPPKSAIDWLGISVAEVWDEVSGDFGDYGAYDLVIDLDSIIYDLRDGSPSHMPTTCAGLNDSGFSFEQIADLVDYFGLIAVEPDR